jgi:hypothetical protein
VAKLNAKQLGITIAIAVAAALSAKFLSPVIVKAFSPNGGVTVGTTIESSSGVTEDQMNLELLDILTKAVTEQVKDLAAKQEKAGGPTAPLMFPESAYVVMSGKKLAVIKIRSQGAASIAVILGIDKQELIKVTCVNKKNEDVDISKGKCFDEIKKSFKLA